MPASSADLQSAGFDDAYFKARMMARALKQARGRLFEWTMFVGILEIAQRSEVRMKDICIAPGLSVPIETSKRRVRRDMWYQKSFVDTFLQVKHIADIAFTLPTKSPAVDVRA
jgi:hypothetical protein